MAAKRSPGEKLRTALPPPIDQVNTEDESEDGEPSNFRFSIAKLYRLHFDCPHAACKRHRTCTRPNAVPCYTRHLDELRQYVFPGFRRAVAHRQREQQRQPPGARRRGA